MKAQWPSCLVDPKGCGFERPVWIESADGFVTRWAVAKVDAGLRKEKDPTRLVQALAGQQALGERVFADPAMELAEDGKIDKGAAPVFALAARVHSPIAQDVALKVSVNSHATIALNDKIIHDEDGDQYLMPDHRRVVVSLREGWNDVAVRLEKTPPYAAQLQMRVRALDGGRVPGLVWDLPSGVTPAANVDVCAAFDIDVTTDVDPAGWKIHTRIGAHGLVPWPGPKRWSVVRGAATLSDEALDLAGLAAAPAAVDALVPADVGEGTIDVKIDGATCASVPHAADADARRRILAAEAAIDKIPDSVLGHGGRESLRFQSDDLRKMLAEPRATKAARRLKPALQALESELSDAAAGLDPFVQPGVHVRAYRSGLDGKLQRYLVAVPRSYAKAKDAVPLVVLAHGLEYTPEDMLRIAFAKPAGPKEAWASGVTYGWDPPATPAGALVVADDGFGNAGSRPPGEADVLQVIDEMQAAYRVDPRRMSISGFSLGGSTTFWVAFHHPDMFGGAAPLCGYPNILDYRSVKAATKRPWEGRLLDEDGVAPYAEGGRYLPLQMVHGAQDNPARSQLIEDRYKKLRYQVDLDIPPLGHNVWDYAFEDGKLLKWLATRKRPKVAPEPVVRAGRLRWAESYWLRIDRFADDGVFGFLSGKLHGERLEVTTRNVRALTLVGRELGERAERPQTIVVDGKSLGEHVVHEGLHLAKGDDGWRVVDAVDAPVGGKRAGLEGPLGDVWFGPQLVVYGTRDPKQTEANRLAAERLSMYAPWVALRVPVKADVAVSDDDLVGRSLVLVGNPASNALTARVAPDLAKAGISFEAHALVVGGERFEGDDVGISVIRPSPFDPDRYVVVHAGVGPEGTLSSRYLPELTPDWLVYDEGIRAVFGDRILGPRSVLAGGFFDDAWQLVPGSVTHGGK
ncbi:MAG: prolyl oligopeptidase family serine peptidase [Myxococcota bacterium]